MASILEVRDLRKSFRSALSREPVQALAGVTFHVARGECFGCLGQNGAGKTTTLKVLTGQIAADSGQALILGQPGSQPSARRNLGYLPENPYFHEHLTPREGLRLFGRLSGMKRGDIERRTPELLERVGLADAADRRVRGFSKGMRQRYGLATTLLAEPEILLLDEPLTGLDPTGRQLVKEILHEEHRAGRTVVMCSHVLSDVQELCDRVVVLHQGSVVRQGAIDDLLDHDARAFEISARQVPPEIATRIKQQADKYHEGDSLLRAVLPGTEAGPDFAVEITQGGGKVLSLVPERESLEEWFVRLTKEAAMPVEAAATEEVSA